MIYTVNIGDSSRRLWKRGYSRLVWIKRRRAKRGKEEKAAEQITLVKETVAEILKKLEEEKSTVNAESHVEYIYIQRKII